MNIRTVCGNDDIGYVHCRTKVAAQAMEICRRGKTPAVQQSVYDVNQNSAAGGSGAMMANLLPTSCGNLTLSFNNHMNSLTNQVSNAYSLATGRQNRYLQTHAWRPTCCFNTSTYIRTYVLVVHVATYCNVHVCTFTVCTMYMHVHVHCMTIHTYMIVHVRVCTRTCIQFACTGTLYMYM